MTIKNGAYLMSKRLLAIALFLLVTPAEASAEERSVFEGRLYGGLYLGDLPTLVADREGLFREQGLDLDVTYSRSGKDNLAALRSGEADFILCTLTPIAIDHLTDPTPGGSDDPVILVNLTNTIHHNHVLVLDIFDNTMLRNADGLRVGLMKGTNAEFIWSMFAAYHGLESDHFKVVDVPPPDLAEALTVGLVDAAVAWEPWTTRLRQQFENRMGMFNASQVYTAKWILVTRRHLVEDRPEAIKALLRAYRKSVTVIENISNPVLNTYLDFYFNKAEVKISKQALTYEFGLNWSVVNGLLQNVYWARRIMRIASIKNMDFRTMLAPRPLMSLYPESVRLSAFESEWTGSTR